MMISRNYIVHPSSEQVRACSDILSDVLSPYQSQQPSFFVLQLMVQIVFCLTALLFCLYVFSVLSQVCVHA